MSLTIRHLTNGKKAVFTVTNSGVAPVLFEIFDKREDIDERIRHYAPEGSPVFCLPDLARKFGVLSLFYPDFPKSCAMPDYADKPCIAESCKYSIYSKDQEKGTCPRLTEQTNNA